MGARAPDYRLREPHEIKLGQDSIILPQGTWVRPVKREYLPSHLFERDWEWKYADWDKKVACYTRYGFYLIPKEKVEVA